MRRSQKTKKTTTKSLVDIYKGYKMETIKVYRGCPNGKGQGTELLQCGIKKKRMGRTEVMRSKIEMTEKGKEEQGSNPSNISMNN